METRTCLKNEKEAKIYRNKGYIVENENGILLARKPRSKSLFDF